MIQNLFRNVMLGGLLLLWPLFSYSQNSSRDLAAQSNGVTVKSIEIKGQRKIEADAIRARLITKVGEPMSSDHIRKDVGAVFEMGYFYNVIVDENPVSGGVSLTYTVVEKPSVVEIEYRGNEEIEKDELNEAAELKAYEILDYSKIQEAVKNIEKLYEEKGFFLARIKYEVQDVNKGESVKLTFNITENDKVVVKKIRFLGNRNIAASKLKSFIQTKEGGYFSFVSGSGSYKQEAFDRDMQILHAIYANEGYVQVKIDRPQVYVTPDKKGIYITIKIEEGEPFNVGTIDFTGDLLFSKEELAEGTELKEGELFVSQKLQRDVLTIQAKYGDLGYAYANPIPRTRVLEKEKIVDITYEIDKGHKVYIGQINVKGNSKTRDKVLRRELRVREGELYHETRKRESQENIQRLGFFDEVTFNTSTPEGRPEIMDIDIVVKERNTGTLQVGAGYSSYQGFVFNGQINQPNLFGRGQNLGFSLNLAKNESLFNLNFTEPYFMDTEWSVGMDLYHSDDDKVVYTQKKTGGAIRVGHPLAPYLMGFVRYKLDKTDLKLDEEQGDSTIYPVETANGTTSSMTFTLQYDKRNDRFSPSRGIFSNVFIEYAGLGGKLNYTKGGANFRYYKKVFWDVVWRNNLTYGFLSSNDGNDPPFNERFLLGGANTLRGFRYFSIGKRIHSSDAESKLKAEGYSNEEAYRRAFLPFGGTQQFYYNVELQFPLIEEAGIKGVVFYDIGDAQDDLIVKDFRSDMGFGFRWFSPIGPLRFEWGFPIDRKEEFDEGAMNFQFAIGTPF